MDAKTAASRLNLLFSDASNEDYAFTEVFAEAVQEGIKALEEIQQYREIGTVEEFKVLKEKADPKICNMKNTNTAWNADNICALGMNRKSEMQNDLISLSALMEDVRNTITEQSGSIDWINVIHRQPTYKGYLVGAENAHTDWIPCEKEMPPVEIEVWIAAKRKWRDGTYKYITTTAMYEDGTVLENDSCWRWEDVDGEWDEEKDCLIIPEGWWENKHYNADGELNHAVDDEVIAWQPLPAPYQPKGE